MQNSPSSEATSCSATHSIPCLLHNTSVHYYFHHSLIHTFSPNFFSPPTFRSHIYSSLNNIVIMVHMFSVLQTQCWHTKMRDKQGETLKNQAIPNLAHWSDTGTNNTWWSSNLTNLILNYIIKFEQPNKNDNNKHNPPAKLPLLNRHNQNPNITTVQMLMVLLQWLCG